VRINDNQTQTRKRETYKRGRKREKRKTKKVLGCLSKSAALISNKKKSTAAEREKGKPGEKIDPNRSIVEGGTDLEDGLRS